MSNSPTSVSKTLDQIRLEVEMKRKSLVQDVQKASKKELVELPETLSQKEKIDYITKVQPHINSIYKMVTMVMPKAQIANTLGVSVLSFRKMSREIPELRTVLELGIEERIDNAETSLYQLANGYTVDKEIINPFDGTKETITEYKDPVLGAIKYILGNKRGEEYADKKQIIRKVELGDDIKTALMSYKIEDLKHAIKLSEAKEVAIDAEFTESDDD